jgi:hypothetical protein
MLRSLPDLAEIIAEGLAEEYLSSLEQQGFPMPWDVHHNGDDAAAIAECQADIKKEFLAFLHLWRENAQDVFDQPPYREM